MENFVFLACIAITFFTLYCLGVYMANILVYWKHVGLILWSTRHVNRLILVKERNLGSWSGIPVTWIVALSTVQLSEVIHQETKLSLKKVRAQSKVLMITSFLICSILSFIPVINWLVLIKAFAVEYQYEDEKYELYINSKYFSKKHKP